MRVDQDAPPFCVQKAPTSVAMYKVLANTGSTTMLFTGMLGRLPLTSDVTRG